MVDTDSTQTLTNKSVDLTNNTLTGTTAQFNTALSDGNFATLAGSETLTNKTLTAAILGGTTDLSGGQIAFPASQSSSAGANTLDDYEEGTFTPVIGGATSESGQAYSIQVGRYVKVGKLVTCYGRVQLSTLGTITGDVVLKTLPFTSQNTANLYGTLTIGFFTSMTTSYTWLGGFVEPNVTYAKLNGLTAAAVSTSVLAQANLSNTSGFIFSVVYEASA
jgi:hypothetical protein